MKGPTRNGTGLSSPPRPPGCEVSGQGSRYLWGQYGYAPECGTGSFIALVVLAVLWDVPGFCQVTTLFVRHSHLQEAGAVQPGFYGRSGKVHFLPLTDKPSPRAATGQELA